MDTKQVILELRTQKGMSQDELAEKVFVSRQAVSRWENGETVPNTETLKLLSKVFDVSINTLLGSPRKLICQCCGMPLEDDDIIGHNHDGSFNEDYCKWCYADGTYTYNDMNDLIEVCVKNMISENFTEEQARSYMKELLPTLDYWKKYDELSDNGQFEEFKKKLINEINELNVEGMPKVEKLNALVGKYVNLEYRLPNGQTAKFLNDAKTYLGNQLECEYGGDRCFGVVADMDAILICTYEEDGKKYMFVGSFNGIYVTELTDDGLSVKRGADGKPVLKKQVCGRAFEGTNIYKKGKYYYLFASINNCCPNNGMDSKYKVVVGRSENLLGPYVDRKGKDMLDNSWELVLEGDGETFFGPGHNSIIIPDDAGTDWMIYHSYVKENGTVGGRLGMLDRIVWSADGWPTIKKCVPSKGDLLPVFNN